MPPLIPKEGMLFLKLLEFYYLSTLDTYYLKHWRQGRVFLDPFMLQVNIDQIWASWTDLAHPTQFNTNFGHHNHRVKEKKHCKHYIRYKRRMA